MNNDQLKRHIGVIPPLETKNRRYFGEFDKVIRQSYRIIPHTLFYNISYEKLLRYSRAGFAYDVVIAARMMDQDKPGSNNLSEAADELRDKLGLSTVFVISFNETLAAIKGMDAKAEKSYVKMLKRREEDPGQASIGGVLRTTSTEPTFLVSVVGDVLDGPDKYLAQTGVYQVETQAQFLNHPPGLTQVGIGE